MKERFLLDGVDVPGAGLAVDQGIKRTLLVDPYSADAPLPVGDIAVMPAQPAQDFLLFELLVERGLFMSDPLSEV